MPPSERTRAGKIDPPRVVPPDEVAVIEAAVIGAPLPSTSPWSRNSLFCTRVNWSGWASVTVGGPVAVHGGGGPALENSTSSTASPLLNPPAVVTETSIRTIRAGGASTSRWL